MPCIYVHSLISFKIDLSIALFGPILHKEVEKSTATTSDISVLTNVSSYDQ